MKKRNFSESKPFSKKLDNFLEKNKLKKEDFEELKEDLRKNPETGDLVPGAGGLRKVRLKSISGGKSGGFRICYYDDESRERIFLITIYSKNEKSDLSPADKKLFKELINEIKKR